jgi:UDP-N-acetylmuramoylalanine-D-glutamate ligase
VAGNAHVRHVCVTGPMAPHISAALRAAGCGRATVCPSLEDAVARAAAVADAAIVFSPGCGVGTMYADKYARGEAFDAAVGALGARVVPAGEAVR